MDMYQEKQPMPTPAECPWEFSSSAMLREEKPPVFLLITAFCTGKTLNGLPHTTEGTP